MIKTPRPTFTRRAWKVRNIAWRQSKQSGTRYRTGTAGGRFVFAIECAGLPEQWTAGNPEEFKP